jgi:hypothetical protein
MILKLYNWLTDWAAGYVVKKYPESLALAIVRAGRPLELNEATRFDWLCSIISFNQAGSPSDSKGSFLED